jgi:hypothetical protein
VAEDGDHWNEQPGLGERGQRRLLTALPDLVGGQRRGQERVGRTAVAAELLSARIQVP